jgi:hypothetical protein
MLAKLLCALWLPVVAAQSLNGVIDIHAHCDPDSVPRSIDAIDLAKLARARGMRGLVLKSHYEPTAALAYIIHKVVPELEVYGGIDLNRTVGGINVAAVEHMIQVTGKLGRVVWMPTFDAENQVRDSKESRPFVAVSSNGALLRDVKAVIQVVARHDLVLATGHSSPEEGLMILREGRAQRAKHMVVTHAMLAPVRMSIPQMQEAAKLGAYIEFVYNALIGPNKSFSIEQYADAIRKVGVEHCILSSDLGQAANPLHPDGLAAFFAALRKQGFSELEIAQMSRRNPAALLGLPVMPR